MLIGATAFAVYLGFAPWANTAHLVPLVAVVGLTLESIAQDRMVLAGLRHQRTVDQPGSVDGSQRHEGVASNPSRLP
jgi:heme exporter protein D